MAILSAQDYTAVRAALDVRLDQTSLPDPIIAQVIYHTMGEAYVKQRIANAETIVNTPNDDNANLVKAAAAFMVAYYMAGDVPRITQARSQYLTFSVNEVNWLDKKDELKRSADQAISVVLGEPIRGRNESFIEVL